LKKKKNYILKDYLSWLIVFLPFILIYSRAIADIIVITTSLYFIYYKLKQRDSRWIHEPWIKISFIIYFWFIFISFFSYNWEIAFTRAIGWIRFIVFITALKNLYLENEIWRKRVLYSVSFSVIYISLFMVIELILIYKDRLINNSNWLYTRLLGPFNSAGKGAIMLSLLFFPALIGNSINGLKFFKDKKLFIFIFLITFICILFSGHRASFYIFSISTFIYTIYLYLNLKNKKFIFKFLSIIVLSLIFLAIFSNKQFDRIFKSSYSDLINYTKSSYYAASETGVKMFMKHPVTGVGLKNFHIACEFPDFISESHKKYNITPWWGVSIERIKNAGFDINNINVKGELKPPTCYTHAHNLYVSLLAETGFIGFFLYLILIFKIIQYFYLNINILKQTPSLGVMISLIPLMTPMLPITNLFSNWNAILLWFSIGWAFSYCNIKKNLK